MPSRPQVYVAGPLGFTEPGRRYHAEVVLPALASAGLDALDPWVLDAEADAVFALPPGHPDRVARLAAVNRAIGTRNADMISAAAGVLAFLDGSDVDSGTAAEIGYAAALAKPIVGVRTDFRPTGDNEATLVNLQVEWFITESGGMLCRDFGDAVTALQRLVRN